MFIAPSDQPRKVSKEIEAQLAAFETAGSGEAVPMSPEAWEELARRKRAEILRDTAAGEQPHPSDEGWSVMGAAFKTMALVAAAIVLVALYARWAVQS